MKKFLSLVLALVMTMSLVTVSAGAKDFSDAEGIQYTEAVEVLSAIGVINGMPDGSFQPEAGLTRAQAAKIITSITLTPDTAAALSTDTAPFSDVPVSHWAAGYIAEGVDSGILAGVGGGKFAPDAELTGYQFLKMLLAALDFDATAEGMTGATWTIAVAKLAKDVGLTAGISNFVGSKAVTREEAAQMALNALKEKKAVYENASSTNITIGDIVISTNPGTAEQTGDYLYKNFKTLKLTKNGEDDLGRPATKWTYEKEEIGTYAGTADYTVTLTKTVKDLCAYLDDEDIVDAKYASDVAYSVNGKDAKTDSDLKAGSIVEVYVEENNDGDEEITDVVVINYTLGEITKVSTKLTKAELKEDAEAKLTIGTSKTVLDVNFAGYDADEYVKGAMILYVLSGDKVLASQVADTVEGTVTAKRDGEVKIDGEWYDDLTAGIAKKAEGVFYLNAAGQIIAEDEDNGKAATSDTFAYIYKTVDLDGEVNEDGVEEADSVKVYVVLTDGTKATYIAEDGAEAKKAENTVVAYSINDDDEFEIKAHADDISIKTVKDANIDKKNVVVADADVLSTTEFIFCDWNSKGTKLTTSTATGYKNVNVDGEVIVVIDDEDVLYVFVMDENGKLTSDDTKYAVILNVEAEESWDEDDDDVTYYTYEVAIDADNDETLTFESALKDIEVGDVIAYTEADDIATFVMVMPTATVGSANDDYYRVGSNRYEYDEETLYTITMEYEDEAAYKKGDVDTIDVSDDATIEKNDTVVLILNSDAEPEIIFVYEYIY